MGGAESTPSAPDTSAPDITPAGPYIDRYAPPPPPPPGDFTVSTSGGNSGISHSSAPSTGASHVAGSVTVTHSPPESSVTTNVSVGGGMNAVTGGATVGAGASMTTVTDAGNTVGVHGNVNTDGTGSIGFSTTF